MSNLKIKAEHLAYMKKEIETKIPMELMVADYEKGNFRCADKVKDLNKRFRADALHYAELTNWVVDNLYPYLYDDYIDSALKSILPKITKRY
ncbi:MAG: hypothetical protein RPT13_03815 [SAR324 cluster bacterium]